MQVGALLPQEEIGNDPGELRAYAEAVEALGYTHVLAYEHVLGAGLANRPDWSGPYDQANPFHEPLLLFSFMAAVTERLGFVTGVFVLPQRQTALVAKQAAELAVLSSNRFRLGVGIGWNEVEYESLGVPFRTRAKRFEEQIALLRALWANDVVDVDGTYDRIPDAGIRPRPSTGAVPLWIGCGGGDAPVERVARLADGWIPAFRSAAAAQPALELLRAHCDRHGRDVATIGIEARLVLPDLSADRYGDELAAWRDAGATHCSISTQRLGLDTVDAHIAFLERFAEDHLPTCHQP